MPSVVSLSPTASAVLIELGAAAALIAVDAESHALPGLAELPVVDLAGSGASDPELVVVPALAESDFERVRVLRERGSDVLEFAPHNFDDAYAACQQLGQRLGRQVRTHTWVRDHAREMAVMSAQSFGYQRPRVAAVIGWAPLATSGGPDARERARAGDGEPGENAPPLVVAGGHSFVTDLIEIGGAESVTHGTEIFRVPMTEAELWATRPDLVLVISPETLPEDERGALRSRLAGPAEIAFLAFDGERFWLKDALPIARHVRELVAPLVRGPLEQPPPLGAPDTAAATR